jgi:hypothetical protein
LLGQLPQPCLGGAGVADWREVEVLNRFPVVLARMATERMDSDVSTARRMWGEVDQLVLSAGVPAADQEAVTVALRSMLEREGPTLAARARAAALLAEAFQGNRWVPRL